MSESQEIEVEVVEVVDKEPTAQTGGPSPQSGHPSQRAVEPGRDGSQRPQTPFGRGIPIRSLKIPFWMWPLAIILGIVLFLLAVVVGLVIVIPFLIIRATLRLLFGPSR